jgi:glycosyltransferase involved in cell wall biosynthesis
MPKTYYSIVIPMRDEEQSLPQLFDEIEKTFRGLPYEVIAVDDASGYATHLGKWEALRVGIDRAKGSIIITMDADLQDDPKELPKLLKKLHEGYDIVSGWREHRQDPLYKIVLTRLANIIYGFNDFSSPMKVYRKKALAQLPKEGTLLRYSLLLAHQLGFRVAEVPVRHRPRMYGRSKFGIIKYVRIFYDLILLSLLFRGSGKLK